MLPDVVPSDLLQQQQQHAAVMIFDVPIYRTFGVDCIKYSGEKPCIYLEKILFVNDAKPVQDWLTHLRFISDKIMAKTGGSIDIQPPKAKEIPSIINEDVPKSKFLPHIMGTSDLSAPANTDSQTVYHDTNLFFTITVASNNPDTTDETYRLLKLSNEICQWKQVIFIPEFIIKNGKQELVQRLVNETCGQIGGLSVFWNSLIKDDTSGEEASHSPFLVCFLYGPENSIFEARRRISIIFDQCHEEIQVFSFDVEVKWAILSAGLFYQLLPSYFDANNASNISFYMPRAIQSITDESSLPLYRKVHITGKSLTSKSIKDQTRTWLDLIHQLKTTAYFVDVPDRYLEFGGVHAYNNSNTEQDFKHDIKNRTFIYRKELKLSGSKAMWLLMKNPLLLERFCYENNVYIEYSELKSSGPWSIILTLYSMCTNHLAIVHSDIMEQLSYIQTLSIELYSDSVPILEVSGSVDKLLEDLGQSYDLDIFRSGPVISFLGSVRSLEQALSTLRSALVPLANDPSSMVPVRTCIGRVCFSLEYARPIREFVSGKKDGKLNKIMRDFGVRVYIQDAYDWAVVIHLESTTATLPSIAGNGQIAAENLLAAVASLQGELPSETSFYIPEIHHKRIIGHGGKNIQKIMKAYGVYVKFVNALEQSKYSSRIVDNIPRDQDSFRNNVLVKTPAKNRQSLRDMKANLLELSCQLDLTVSQQIVVIDPWKLDECSRNGLKVLQSQFSDDDAKTSSTSNLLGYYLYPKEWFLNVILIKNKKYKIVEMNSLVQSLYQTEQSAIIPNATTTIYGSTLRSLNVQEESNFGGNSGNKANDILRHFHSMLLCPTPNSDDTSGFSSRSGSSSNSPLSMVKPSINGTDQFFSEEMSNPSTRRYSENNAVQLGQFYNDRHSRPLSTIPPAISAPTVPLRARRPSTIGDMRNLTPLAILPSLNGREVPMPDLLMRASLKPQIQRSLPSSPFPSINAPHNSKNWNGGGRLNGSIMDKNPKIGEDEGPTLDSSQGGKGSARSHDDASGSSDPEACIIASPAFRSRLVITSVAQWKTPIISEQLL